MIFLKPPRDLSCAASPCQVALNHAREPILLLAKAQIKNANTGDLFAVPVSIPAYVRSGHVVAPHVAIRHKAPAEVSHARALIIPAHRPEPVHPVMVTESADDELRRLMDMRADRLAAYDPEKAVSKLGKRWMMMTEQGSEHPSLFDTRKEAVAMATRHIALRRDQMANPSNYWDVVSIRASDRIKRAAVYQKQGLGEIEAYKRAEADAEAARHHPAPSPVFGMLRVSKEHTDAIIGKLIADHAKDLSDAELDRILSPTVGGPALTKMAQHLRDTGALTPDMIPYQAPDDGPPMVVTTTPPVDLKAQAQRKAQAKKLREGAQSHLAQAEEDLSRDRQSNTARRARMAAGSIKDAQQRALIAGTMNNIADLIEAGEAVHLAGISTRAQVEALDLAARQSVYGWERDTNQPYHGDREIIPELKHVPHAKLPAGEWNVKERARLEKMGLKTNQDLQAALREYLPLRSERRREDPIKAAERALVGTKPGIDFFPTPPPLAQRMVQLANINPGERVLEPSAGKGDIADAIRAAGGKVDAVELSNTLRAVLEAKGHKLVGQDFETFEPTELYDAIVMNPPWSGGADVRHVMRAYDMLKPGGRLVALMSMHASFASDKASVAFRGWMEELGASSQKHPAEDFKSQWMSGGIPSWLVSVRKPMTKAMFFKAQIKGANTGDLFSQPVNVKAYVRNGHTVAAHTEVRQVRHEAPPAPKPPAPAEDKPSAGITHFYVSAIDGSKKHLVAGPYATLEEAKAMVEGVRKHADSDPRAHFMAWGTAGTDREHKTPLGKWAPAAAKLKPIPIIKRSAA